MSKVFATVTRTRKLLLVLSVLFFVAGSIPSVAQTSNTDRLKSLRSDVGIIGLTANFSWMNDFKYKGNDPLQEDTNSELEFVIRDVRTISPRAAVGFQILTSFFAGDSDFGLGGWGIGPVVRGYPFHRDQWQPYFEADALFGSNMGLGDLADSRTAADGFRVRLGMRGGLTYRINNHFGLFLEGGPDWEGSRFFNSDAMAWQLNFGIDLYRFN